MESIEMKVLDLFSGFGGFSEAFLLAGCEVTRVENNPLLAEVECTTLQCVKEWFEEVKNTGLHFDVILASPPCTEFSLAYNSPRSNANRAGEEYQPDLSLVELTKDIIEWFEPQYYVIENVVGSARYFANLGLIPNQIIRPYLLYGRFPKFSCPPFPSKADKDTHGNDPLRSNHRAKVPFELSWALYKAIRSQQTLTRWF